MSRLVIVEGLDRVGKSSLCSLIANKIPTFEGLDFKVELAHFGVPPVEKTKDFYLDKLKACFPSAAKGIHETIEEDGRIIVFDRSFISNVVYNGVFGGGVMPYEDYLELLRFTDKCDPIYIFLYDGPNSIYARMLKEMQETPENSAGLLTFEQVQNIQSRFFDAFTKLRGDTRIFAFDSLVDCGIVNPAIPLEEQRMNYRFMRLLCDITKTNLHDPMFPWDGEVSFP